MNLHVSISFVFFLSRRSFCHNINKTNVVSANFFADMIIALIDKFALYFIDIVVR